ncbi:MAG: tetratricopeptide repeat protein [Candidatus Riflebacteria bacterium]|nr:tetratricopeptide repeat protein [Candidatus Riflebacteria bacterium]
MKRVIKIAFLILMFICIPGFFSECKGKDRESEPLGGRKSPDFGEFLKSEKSLKIRALLDRGEYRDAEGKAREIVDGNPKDAEARYLLGEALLLQGETTSAKKQLEIAIILKPENLNFSRELGKILDEEARDAVKASDNETAAAAWKRCLELKYKPREISANLAEAYRSVALKHLTAKKYDEAEKDLREAIAILPTNPVIRLDLSNFLIGRDRLQEAHHELVQLMADHPRYEDGLVSVAKLQWRMGEVKNAIDTVDRALEIAPGNAKALKLKKELEKEIPANVLASKPSEGTKDEPGEKISTELANLEGTGDLRGQCRLLEKILEENPKAYWAQLRLAKVYERLGENSLALATARSCLNERPDDTRASFLLAHTMQLSGDLTGALKTLDELEKGGKVNLQIYDEMGQIYAKMGKFLEAKLHWKKALEIDPEFPGTHFSLGQMAMEEGKFEEAKAFFKKALEKEPQNLKFRYFAGMNLKQAGKSEEAIQIWKEAKAFLNPQDPYSKRISRALGEKDSKSIEDNTQFSAETSQPVVNPVNSTIPSETDKPPLPPNTVDSKDKEPLINANTVPQSNVPQASDSDETLYKQALEFARNSKFSEAIAGFSEIVSKNPNHLNALINLGNVYLATQQPAEAAARFLRALKVNPKNSFAKKSLLKTYEELGFNPGEKNVLTGDSIDFSINEPRSKSNPRSFSPLIKSFLRNQLDEEAANITEIAVQENPELPEAYLLQGEVYRKCGKLDLAEIAYRKAIELDKSAPYGYLKLGDLYSTTGRGDAAKGFYEKALQSKDVDTDTLIELVDRFRGIGDHQTANEVVNRIKGMNLSDSQMSKFKNLKK